MDKNNVVSAEIVRQITRMVVEELQKQQRLERSTPIGVSNRHVHLDRADMDALFGPGSELTVKKMLGQPGQYASEETVTIRGPKGELSRVRVLGPLRAQTQVEISIADGFTLGVKPPVRESGQLKDTPGIEIIGPCGSVKKDSGVIAAETGNGNCMSYGPLGMNYHQPNEYVDLDSVLEVYEVSKKITYRMGFEID